VGDQAVLDPLIREHKLSLGDRLSVMHTSETVAMDDTPMAVLRRKKDSSMVRAIELVKGGEADVVVSCGNTAALMAVGTLRLRTIDGITRPALAAIVPREAGHFVLIDAGANPEAKAEHLVHNAILGSHYCRVVLGIESPRVGLMTIGTEEGKGNALISEANELFKRVGTVVNYAGPIEGFQVFKEHVDVVVCDGFVGNIMLKSWESLVSFVRDILRDELKANVLRMSGAWLSRGAFNALKERINPERYGGAPLLGLKGNILKAHGSSNRRAILSAIRAANGVIAANMNHRIEVDVARANEMLTH
jgi:glycerol-3-phosphate acyltransferase PlsX